MRKESGWLLWALFPAIAVWWESRPPRRAWRVLILETLVPRLAVWGFFIWSVVQLHWSSVLGAGLALFGLGLLGLGAKWFANRAGWRQRWLQS